MLSNSELEKLQTILSGYAEIEAVYLFGSAASDAKEIVGDIDLGIVDADPSGNEK